MAWRRRVEPRKRVEEGETEERGRKRGEEGEEEEASSLVVVDLVLVAALSLSAPLSLGSSPSTRGVEDERRVVENKIRQREATSRRARGITARKKGRERVWRRVASKGQRRETSGIMPFTHNFGSSFSESSRGTNLVLLSRSLFCRPSPLLSKSTLAREREIDNHARTRSPALSTTKSRSTSVVRSKSIDGLTFAFQALSPSLPC